MNVGEIKTRVKRQFGDESGVQITNADILRWINDGQLEIVRKTECLEGLATTVTTVEDESYSVPTEFIRIERVTYDGNRLQEITMEKLDELYPNRDSSDVSGEPEYYYLWSRNIWLYPAPSSAKSLAIYYIKIPNELSADEEDPEIPVTFHNAIVRYCLAQAKELNEEYKEAQNIKAELDVELTLGDDEQNAQATYPSVRLAPGDDEWHPHL